MLLEIINSKEQCWITVSTPALSFAIQDVQTHLRKFPGELSYIAKDISSTALIKWTLNEPAYGRQTFIKVSYDWCCFSIDYKSHSIDTKPMTVDSMLNLLHHEMHAQLVHANRIQEQTLFKLDG